MPHITIADEAAPERIAAAQVALADYRMEVTFDRVHLLEQGDRRIWRPIADAAFRTPAVLGRGGLPLELSVTTILDPEAAEIAEIVDLAENGQVAITARRDGRVIGVLVGSTSGAIAEVHSVAVIPEVSDEGVDDHLRAAFYSLAAE